MAKKEKEVHMNFRVSEDFYFRFKTYAMRKRMSMKMLLTASFEKYLSDDSEEELPAGRTKGD